VGDTVAITPKPDSIGDWSVTLEYRGLATRSPRGAITPAGRPVRFSYERFEPAMDWQMRFVSWDDSADPRTQDGAFQARLRSEPVHTLRAPRLDFLWFRPTIRELPPQRFALEAVTAVTLDSGTYTLRTLSDDGIRVWVDNGLVIDNWGRHGTEVDYAPLQGGRHAVRVQYFQVDGWTELRLEILRGVVRSPGSPGPH
jgi:hypothetical protein